MPCLWWILHAKMDQSRHWCFLMVFYSYWQFATFCDFFDFYGLIWLGFIGFIFLSMVLRTGRAYLTIGSHILLVPPFHLLFHALACPVVESSLQAILTCKGRTAKAPLTPITLSLILVYLAILLHLAYLVLLLFFVPLYLAFTWTVLTLAEESQALPWNSGL